jgi:hypothetical protein
MKLKSPAVFQLARPNFGRTNASDGRILTLFIKPVQAYLDVGGLLMKKSDHAAYFANFVYLSKLTGCGILKILLLFKRIFSLILTRFCPKNCK